MKSKAKLKAGTDGRKTIINLEEAIEVRHSRRTYLPTPLDSETVDRLRQLVAFYAEKAGSRIELVLDNGSAFEGLRRNYGLFSGVRHYMGLIDSRTDSTSVERLGYYGELIVLNATALGLGSCWVGGTFDRSICPFSVAKDETLVCTIVVGNVEQRYSMKEKLIHSVIHRKTKSAEEMYASDSDVPDWFLSGMYAVQKAPSSANRQPVKFSFEKGEVRAWVENIADPAFALDFGIAKCHFELGAKNGSWNWGNHAEFIHHHQ